jgi:hypothetical protein
MMDRVIAIARGGTAARSHVATVRVSCDDPGWERRDDKRCRGFFWAAYDHRGRAIMHGGIIDRGREGPPDWSIHT